PLAKRLGQAIQSLRDKSLKLLSLHLTADCNLKGTCCATGEKEPCKGPCGISLVQSGEVNLPITDCQTVRGAPRTYAARRRFFQRLWMNQTAPRTITTPRTASKRWKYSRRVIQRSPSFNPA